MERRGFTTPLGSWYRLGDSLGRGAAGEVFRAIDLRTDEVVAAKVLRTEHTSDPDLVDRFLRERAVLTGLRDDHVVAVRDLVAEGDRLAIVMDFVPGGSLREVLAASHTLAPALACEIAAGTMLGLAAAHDAKVSHRDIKPDNVLLMSDWQQHPEQAVRVVDFGIAGIVQQRTGATTGLLGTPEYMGPELISQGVHGPEADVYAVGVMLYEMLAGRTPFSGPGNDFAVAYRHVTAEVPPLPVPEALWDELQALLEKAPSRRPGARSAAASLRQLSAALGDVKPLEPMAEPTEFGGEERPRTVLRSMVVPEVSAQPDADAEAPVEPEPLPELGTPTQETRLRPMPRPAAVTRPAGTTTVPAESQPWWRNRRLLAIIAASLVVTAGLIWVMVASTRGHHTAGGGQGSQMVATQTDQALPTGLTTSRQATYDPAAHEVTLQITYSAQKATLRGPLLESLPPLQAGGVCPTADWTGATAQPNLPSVTGIDTPCGWSIDPIQVPAQGSTVVHVALPLQVGDQTQLQQWLQQVADSTTQALTNSQVQSLAYPVQRLQGIEVGTPSRMVSGQTVPVTLNPVWPSGSDKVNPLYRSPATGDPSSMLTAISGGASGVRFTDGCSGALRISPDGHVVTALSMQNQCKVDASVGNFTSLESQPFDIVTRGS